MRAVLDASSLVVYLQLMTMTDQSKLKMSRDNVNLFNFFLNQYIQKIKYFLKITFYYKYQKIKNMSLYNPQYLFSECNESDEANNLLYKMDEYNFYKIINNGRLVF